MPCPGTYHRLHHSPWSAQQGFMTDQGSISKGEKSSGRYCKQIPAHGLDQRQNEIPLPLCTSWVLSVSDQSLRKSRNFRSSFNLLERYCNILRVADGRERIGNNIFLAKCQLNPTFSFCNPNKCSDPSQSWPFWFAEHQLRPSISSDMQAEGRLEVIYPDLRRFACSSLRIPLVHRNQHEHKQYSQTSPLCSNNAFGVVVND